MAGEARRRRRYIAGGGQHEGDQGHSSHSCTAAWRAHPCAKGTAAQKTTQVRRNESRRWAMKDDETQRRARIGNSGTTTRAELNECYIGVTTDWNPDPVNQRDRPISNSFLHPPRFVRLAPCTHVRTCVRHPCGFEPDIPHPLAHGNMGKE